MANFFTDNKDIQFLFNRLPLERIIRLKEKNFTEKDKYPYAPEDVEDAKDSYRRVLEVLGELAAEYIEPRAEGVDLEGSHFDGGVVRYATGIQEALDMLSKAGVMGFTLPRRFGGLNFPVTIYTIAIELISRADASLMNLFGLQDIAETINAYASEELKQKYLPRFCTGELTGAMVLTEPDAGSDLQSVQLKATEVEPGKWVLEGVKRFITNGCGDVLLVLARSEPNITGGRGLSLFLCEKGPTVRVRRIEDKLGIHGSPTCELYFDKTPAYLIGKRKFGLIKYVMSLMNGARLAVAAQAIGIAEAAYRAALSYAKEREQFGVPIIEFAPIKEMLYNMVLKIEAARTLVYETAMAVDTSKGLEEAQGKDWSPVDQGCIKEELKYYTALAEALTPMSKYFASEIANQVAYDAIQVLGGSGYMKDYAVERYYRDARITNIYEGTTQLQIVAAIGGVLKGTIREYVDKPLTLFKVSQLLWAAQGITSRDGKRAAPSAGATYPIELYLVAGMVEGLEPGVYHYIPENHSLRLVFTGDVRAELMEACLGQSWVGDAPVSIVICAVYERTTARYGERGIRYVHIEVGCVCENIYLEATALVLGTVAVGAFYDDQVSRVLDLPAEVKPLLVMPVGVPYG